jgi:hypothetical protein
MRSRRLLLAATGFFRLRQQGSDDLSSFDFAASPQNQTK